MSVKRIPQIPGLSFLSVYYSIGLFLCCCHSRIDLLYKKSTVNTMDHSRFSSVSI